MKPTCLAFASSDAHAALRSLTEPLGPEFLFRAARANLGVGAPNSGVTVGSISKALENDGQPLESAWPYDPHDEPTQPPLDQLGEIFKCESIEPSIDFDSVWMGLQGGVPLVLATRVTPAWNKPLAAPFVISERVLGGGGHAVLACGCADEQQLGRSVLVRNSWGDRWGDGGYAWLTEGHLSMNLFAALRMENTIG